MSDYDLIIVGGGGAGLAAGIMARKAGASVMVLEADSKLGGATAWSAAVMYACNTSIQKARGIHDTPDAMFNYMMTLAGWDTYPRIMRVLCEQSGPTLEWLISLGVQFPVDYLLCSGVDEVPRGHPSGGVATSLINAAGAAGVEHALGTRVDKLLVENGRVVGVSAGGETLRGGAVIVTTGGFGNSPEMIKDYYPTAAYHGDWTYAVHMKAPFIVGDGIKLGKDIGADIVGEDTGLLLPTSGLGKFFGGGESVAVFTRATPAFNPAFGRRRKEGGVPAYSAIELNPWESRAGQSGKETVAHQLEVTLGKPSGQLDHHFSG